MASQSQPFHIVGGSNAGGHLNVDTTYTKIFVGGLAWETQRDTMTRYFEQFGEILEAVVITDKNTGRSKGYGFDSAMRACQNPSPVIDGRRANCNLASIGASNRTRPTTPQYGMGRMRSQATSAAVSAAYRGLSAAASISTGYFHHPSNYAFPYYGYSGGYPQETMYPVSYFGIGGSGQQHQHHFSPYYPANPGVYPNYYPYYVQYSQSAQAQSGGFGLHYPQMLQYPYLPQQFGSGSPILSLPVSVSAPTAGVTAGAVVVSSSSQPVRTVPDHDIVSSTA